MRRLHLKASKKKAKNNVLLSAIQWVFGFAGTLYLSWLLLFPSMSGDLGRWLSVNLASLLGFSAYVLPLLLLNGLLQFIRGGRKGLITNAAASLSVQLSAASLLALAAGWMSGDPAIGGGAAGTAIASLSRTAVGGFGASAFGLGVLLFSLQLVFGIRWSQVAGEVSKLLGEDYRQWLKSRQELQLQLDRVKPLATTNSPVTPEAAPAQKPVKPVNVNEPLTPIVSVPSKPLVVKDLHDAPPKPIKASSARAAAPAPAAYVNYKLPSSQLLNPPSNAKDTGKPTEGEIADAIAELERTLKSFDIDAKVTGYAPGPVITRYELSPAPGVKVSSIVVLENDIALAMRAKGIRIIAPIPGKAAVGIEIPNQRPAMVVLREILESSAIPEGAPLLSFALGLSSSGAPVAADVQKMPHVLIAGATNSGKSVAIHTLILSILFRARPDEVKFLMIDPKRLELSFYDGIPHLFNPTASADKVQVVTNPKDASKALLALVKLMERRYEKFQLFAVRNIDSYNKEADKRGIPREFFVVVVIDELADLMLIAADTVEDSIQRLTQMARAVGIHLVLATQRPSVDVITGVIKANLPSRIALQVISKVDSKVILDCTGAESLQGKGDLLYLAAGSQKPERCQGAYVGEDEINKVVAYLKTQGKPDYPLLETMAKGGDAEADLASFGVEPLEFSQALKLVLERRRVSQDLLKSQFGSSARATNILSALEVKELIHKPEGSNRWEIHFDQIEEYMRKHFPQVPIDRPGSDRD